MALVLLSLTGASVLACLTKKEKESGENMFFTEPHSIEEINNGKVLILVSADWCASCPAVKRFLGKQQKNIKKRGYRLFEFYDVKWRKVGQTSKPKNPFFKEMIEKYSIEAVPTLLVLENGEVKMKLIGSEEIETILTQLH